MRKNGVDTGSYDDFQRALTIKKTVIGTTKRAAVWD